MENVVGQEVSPQTPSQKTHLMDSKMWIIIAALVLLVLLIGGFYLYRNKGITVKKQTVSTNNSATILHPTPTSQNASNIKNTSTTNSQLDLDMQKVNSDYDNLNNDSVSVDQGLNDQQTNLQ